MNIEQAIYTHTKVRRDTHSTGFGYYSMTPGMERLLKESHELSAASAGYISPRNSECWWEMEEQDITKRDDIEARRIREHHPVSFGYTTVTAGGRQLAALTFVRNLGRDLSPLTRDGNILVNTLALEADELRGYPYSYYGSRELFLDCERGFFLNAGDEPADDLEPLFSISPGSEAPTAEEIESFLEEDDRIQWLCAMLCALMEINDGGRLRRIIVCDSRENIIRWIAALSLIYPAETAKSFTFRTYSFFGSNADDFTPAYDDVMFCGAYTPSVNGDPESARATNYDFAAECANETSAVFDVERGCCEETEDSYPYFGIFIESAFSTDIRILKSYHDFILERTTCRSLGSDYAKGYGCYTILQLKNEHSLKYLTDAVDFAAKYMDGDTVRQLLSIAYSRTIDVGKEGASFADIIGVSADCVRKGIAAGGLVRAHYISFLIRLITSEDTERADYFRLKEQIRDIFHAGSESVEAEFVSAFTVEGIMQMTSSVCKRWKLIELADCVSHVMSDGGSHFCGTDEELTAAFNDLSSKIILSEKRDRPGLIRAFADMFPQAEQKIAYMEDMYALFGACPDIRRELVGCAAELCLSGESDVIAAAAGFADKHGEGQTLCLHMIEASRAMEDISRRAELFCDLLSCSGGRLDGSFELFVRELEICTRDSEGSQSAEAIYLIFDFVSRCGRADSIDLPSLCKRYYRAASAEYGRYGLDGEAGMRLLTIAASLPDPLTVLRGHIGNMATMLYIKLYAGETDQSRMCISSDKLQYINFELMRKAERNDCIEMLGKAFADRSRAVGTALGVRYEQFINPDDESNDKVIEELFLRWIAALAETQSKDCAKLIGQTLAMSAVKCRLDADAVGELLT
ncbi:MAG: hypothetical protein IJ723_07340, partial [Ruminococcus sp.]|nr:hypothetical protein [Ruminococcus sp.]